MMSLGKLKLSTELEVAGFNYCVIIESKPQILGSSPRPWPRLPFLLRIIL